MPLATATSFTRAFLPCWLVTYLLASISHSLMVLLSLTNLGTDIDASAWLSVTLKDIAGLLPVYGSLTAAALFLALTVTGFFTARFSSRRYLIPLATGVAMLVLLLLMESLLQFTLIAGARSPFGLCLQVLAGVSGGMTFMALFRQPVRG